MSGLGDSDSKAYVIALIGGVVGGLLGAKISVFFGAYLPVLIYQLGLDIPSDAAGLGHSQGEQGATRFLIALLASLVPGMCGLVVGILILQVVYGIDT
jgi:hypothetical protein